MDGILLANAPLLEDGPWQGGRRFLQREGLEQARIRLLRGLSRGLRLRQQLQNIYDLAPCWAAESPTQGCADAAVGQGAGQSADRSCLTTGCTDVGLM